MRQRLYGGVRGRRGDPPPTRFNSVLYVNMAKRTFNSICIALEQLETALRLYEAGEEYFSVITLAGAAEDIIRKKCEAKKIETSLASLQNAATEIHKLLYPEIANDEKALKKVFADRANYARNKAKHINPSVEPTLTIDPKEEARDLLNRAIDNYWALEKNLTPAMRAFSDGQRNV